MHHQIDLAKYAERIGFQGDFEPNFETLCRIQNLHTCSIPFENFSVLFGEPVLLDSISLEQKLVTRRRGGYCFEQNGFLLAVLLQIGFAARPFSGRVRIGSDRDFLPPRTHLFVMVELLGKTYIIDAGVGSMSLTSPIEFVVDAIQSTPHEARRIIKENGIFFHQAWSADQWNDVYESTGEEMPLIDREVSS